MSRTRKSFAALATGVAIALSLAACGGGAGNKPAQSGDAAKPDNAGEFSGDPAGALTTLGFGMPDEVASARVDLFKSDFPDVDLKINDGAFDEQVFLSSVAAGNPPDLVQLPSGQVGSYAARGALQPLDACIAEREIPMDQYRPEWKDTITYGDEVYGIPEFYNTPVMIVNNVALEEAGLTLDDISLADQDKLMNLTEKLTKMSPSGTLDRVGISLRIPELLPLYGYIDGHPWISGQNDINLDDPATIATFERLKEVQDAMGGQAKLEDTDAAWDFWGEANPFTTNQIGVLVIEQWYVNVLAQNSPDVDITILPITGADGELITQATGNIWAMSKNAKNPAAACQFMKTMTSVPAWEAAATARIAINEEEGTSFTGLYTGNVWADEAIFDDLYPEAPSTPVFTEAVAKVRDAQASAKVDPATAIGAQYATAWQEAANAFLKGETSAADALALAQKKVDEALAAVK